MTNLTISRTFLGARCVHVMSLALLCAPMTVFSQDVASAPVAAQTPTPKHVTAIEELIQTDVSISGTFVARQTKEIAIASKRIQPLVVAEVAEHGARVQKGDVILRLEVSKLDEMIADQEAVVALSELSLKEAESQLRIAMGRAPLTKEQTELTKRYADEDFKRFREVEHPFAQKAAEQSLRSSSQNLEYTEEELKQLEQMYKADDLTEQTEEIILRRARNDVDRSRFFFDQMQKEYEKSTKFTLPRNVNQQETAHRLAELAYEQAVVTQSVEVDKQRISLDKTRFEHKRASKELAELRQDRKLMTFKSPIAGVVYYGRETDGKWSSVAELAKRLARHGTIAPHEVVMTIVDNESLGFVGKVSEADLGKIHQGVAGRVTPTARPGERLTARVQIVDEVPIADGLYRMNIDVDTTPQQRLVAGMTGTAKFTTYANAKAIVVPAKVVFTDSSDDTKRYVYVMGSDGRSERRECAVGVTSGDRIEIVSGVLAGDKLLEEKPAS